MKIKINFSVEVDPKKVRAEFNETEKTMSNSEIKEFFKSHAKDALEIYIHAIDVGIDNE